MFEVVHLKAPCCFVKKLISLRVRESAVSYIWQYGCNRAKTHTNVARDTGVDDSVCFGAPPPPPPPLLGFWKCPGFGVEEVGDPIIQEKHLDKASSYTCPSYNHMKFMKTFTNRKKIDFH